MSEVLNNKDPEVLATSRIQTNIYEAQTKSLKDLSKN